MPTASSLKSKYRPTLLERLADPTPIESHEMQPLRLMTVEELKESVAKDLESLLNCRCAPASDVLDSFPEALQSIYTYGMHDFVGCSLANPGDRNHICRSLERTIAIHERRLKEVRISLSFDNDTVNRLKFTINALLVVHPSAESVYFDALLQPSTLQYSVSKTRYAAVV